MDERTLRRAIFQNPAEDAPRLMYADWLEERGDPYGEFIRVQCLLARSPKPAEKTRLRKRQKELLAAYQSEWLELIVPPCRDPEFRRGFVERAVFGVDAFISHGLIAAALTPLRDITLRGGKRQMTELADCQALEKIERLEFDYNDFDDQSLIRLSASAHLGRLEQFRLHKHDFSAEGAAALFNCASLTNLRSLELANITLGDEGVVPIAEANNLRGLASLTLSYCRVGDRGVEALARSPLMTQLTSLNLDDNRTLHEEGIAALASSPHLKQLKTLSLSYCNFSNRALRTLAEITDWKHLHTLNLNFNRINDVGVLALANSPLIAGLKKLHLAHSGVTMAGVRAIVNSPYWNGKTKLHLRGCMLNDAEMGDLTNEFGRTFGNF